MGFTTNTIITIVTAYCACTKCCGPKAAGITAAGTKSVAGRTIAGPRNYPLYSIARIGGKTYQIEDRTAKRFDGRFDIFFSTHHEALEFGIKTQRVEIIRRSKD